MKNPIWKWLVPLGCAALGVLAYERYGWQGVAAVGGGVVMWLLLHFTRMMAVLRRAAERPVGYVASAVMLNAKLKRGVPLLHVVAMTRSLGVRQGAAGGPVEVYRWTDGSASHVDCTFTLGKLTGWQLERPDTSALGGISSAP